MASERPVGFANESLEALQGHPLARGKRLRAIMALLICRSVGVPAAAAAAEALMLVSEMIHNASLVMMIFKMATPPVGVVRPFGRCLVAPRRST